MTRFLLVTAAVLPLALAFAGPAGAAGAPHLQWFGQAAVKITTVDGQVILIDPFISSNPATPEEHKDLEELGRVDLILVTHAHGDHWGDSARIAEMTGAPVAVNADFGSTLSTLGVLPRDRLIRFNKSGPIQPIGDGITITMTHAEHSSDFVHEPGTGEPSVHPGGEPAGYIIELENGYTIWHMGDTGVFDGMEWIARHYQPDLILMPIGGHYTMDPAHAAYATRELIGGAPSITPIHYGTFAPLSGTPEQFREALGETDATIEVMQPGQTRPLR